MQKCFYARDGFSLVELSIVLVILGLLTGGILTGQNLIRAAELRGVSTELQAHRTSLFTFRDKYFALPGDMNNATDFWGAAHSSPSTCITTEGSGTQTCNGNADGRISTCSTALNDCNERYRAYEHLANSGLIEGSYTGVAGGGGEKHAVIGVNVPASRVGNAGWTLFYMGSRTGHASFFDGFYGHTYWFGAQDPAFETAGDVLSPEEAWNIDTKIDDGNPATGFVLERKGNTDNLCTTSEDPSTVGYALSTTSVECQLIIKTQF